MLRISWMFHGIYFTNDSEKYGKIVVSCDFMGYIPSGKQPHNYGNSPFAMGKPPMKSVFSIAMFDYKRVIITAILK